MKLNYIPGLSLRFFPGLTRELYDGVDDYTATGCKLVIMTGAAPTETELWNLTDLEAFVTANAANVVYRETTSFKFSYNGFKHQRIIQRMPIDSTNFTALNATVQQPTYTQLELDTGNIKSDNSLYALIYCPDKDTTANTAGNDLVMLVTNVGNKPDDFVSLSANTFAKDASLYLRNVTISMFQGYQITDAVITGSIPDPDHAGQTIQGPIGTKKSIYYNKVWGNRLSEAYRDCFISKTSFIHKNSTYTNTLNLTGFTWSKILNDFAQKYLTIAGTNTYYPILRQYDSVAGAWTANSLHTSMDTKLYGAYLVNESMINLLDEINNRSVLNQFSLFADLVGLTYGTTSRFIYGLETTGAAASSLPLTGTYGTSAAKNIIPGLLAKYALTQSSVSSVMRDSITALLIEQGLDIGMIQSALKSVVPVDLDLTKFSSTFDKDSGVLTIQNSTPAKLKTRYKKTVNNPTNEQLYILLPRYLNRSPIECGVQANEIVDTGITANTDPDFILYGSLSSVSYPATQKVIDGEVIDLSSQRIRQQDYTAVSIGATGNGSTDLEYDVIDIIDYIDSFTTMVKIPNKF